MSAFSGELERGKGVYHDGKKKIIKDWFFTSHDGCPNSDLILICFTDGSNTKQEGFSKIKYLKEKKC